MKRPSGLPPYDQHFFPPYPDFMSVALSTDDPRQALWRAQEWVREGRELAVEFLESTEMARRSWFTLLVYLWGLEDAYVAMRDRDLSPPVNVRA